MPSPTRSLTALAAPLTLVLSACGGEGEAVPAASAAGSTGTVTVAHAQGSTEVPVDPETVVVFDYGVLATMDALGLEADGVPASTTGLPEELSHYAGDDVPKVGSLKEADLEAVNALDPDLIIVAARSAAMYPQMSEIAPTVDLTVDSTDFLAGSFEQARAIGEVFGVSSAVEERIAGIESAAQEVRAAAEASGDVGLVLRVEGAEVTAYGPGSRYGVIHDALGVADTGGDFVTDTPHGQAVSFEYVAEADPDLIFVQDPQAPLGDTTGPNAATVLDNPLVAGTSAGRNDGIVYLELFTWYLAPSALPSLEEQVATVREAVA